MAKKSQLDRAIEELCAKRDAILEKASTEVTALNNAMDVLKQQQRRPARPAARVKATVEVAPREMVAVSR